jgi:SET domain-containing protein 6
MSSLRPIKVGEEVLNYYGPLPNSDLLRRYGYTSVKHQAHDVVEINLSTILDATKVELGLRDLELSEAVGVLYFLWT